MKTADQLQQDKIERETHEILLILQGSGPALQAALERTQAAATHASSADGSARAAEAAAERAFNQIVQARGELRQVNGRLDDIDARLDRFEEKLDQILTIHKNIERASLAPHGAAETTTGEDAAASHSAAEGTGL
jgi:DNA repair ATPase RecN